MVDLSECVRRERERAARLRGELGSVIAKSVVLRWHSRQLRRAANATPAVERAVRAELAKRNRETVIRTAPPASGPTR